MTPRRTANWVVDRYQNSRCYPQKSIFHLDCQCSFQEVLKERTYRFAYRPSKNNDKAAIIVLIWLNRIQFQIKSLFSEHCYSIFIITILFASRIACDTNGVHKWVMIWELCFLKNPVAATFSSCIALGFKPQVCRMEGTVPSHYKAVNYLLDTCATIFKSLK